MSTRNAPLFKKKQLIENFKTKFKNFEIIFSNYTDSSKGTCTIIRKNLASIENITFGLNSRIISINLKIKNQIINITNIYAPNDAQSQMEFIDEINQILIPEKDVILLGDFNSIQSHEDTPNKEKKIQGSKNLKKWKKFYFNNSFKEADFKNKKSKSMTWSSGNKASRIDRIYIKSSKVKGVYQENVFMYESDHRLVIATINSLDNTIKKSKCNLWKLNETVLEDQLVKNKIRIICENINTIKLFHGNKWYDEFISQIIKLLKSQSRILNNEKNQVFKMLNQQLQNLDINLANGHENPELILASIRETEARLKELHEDTRRSLEVKDRRKRIEFIRQPSLKLIGNLKINNQINTIDELDCNGVKIKDEALIKRKLFDFYKSLYSEDQSVTRLNENSSKNLNKISNECSNFTYNEVFGIINQMRESSPGPNGLTLKFYKQFFPLFGPHFVTMLNDNTFKDNLLFNVSMIKLIPKNKSKMSPESFRPITITNLDYRIVSKALANRAQAFLEPMINELQTCGIPNRKISSNIKIIRDIIDLNNNKKEQLFILSLDQKKAFDCITAT